MSSSTNLSGSIQDRIHQLKNTNTQPNSINQNDSTSSHSRQLYPSSQQTNEFFSSQQHLNPSGDYSQVNTAGKPNLIAPISISSNNSRGVFIRPQSTATYSMSLTTLSSSSSVPSTNVPKNAPFQKTIITESYFIAHNRSTLSVFPISLTNESTKLSTDDNFHHNQTDKPCSSSVLRFSLHNFTQNDQKYLHSLPDCPESSEIDETGSNNTPNQWSIDQLLDRPLPLLSPADISNLPSTNSLVSDDHVAALQNCLSQHSTNSKDFTHYHIVSLFSLFQLECASSLRYIPCPSSCVCSIPFSQKISLPLNDKIPSLRKAFLQQLQIPPQSTTSSFSTQNLSASLLTSKVPETTIIDFTDPAFIQMYLAKDASKSQQLQPLITPKRTHIPSIIDITPLSATQNTFLLATDTSTTMIIKVVQGMAIPLLTIDPFSNTTQSTALHNIVKHYTDQSISSLFPISSHDEYKFIKQPKGQVIVTAISASPTSKHNLIAISYALYQSSYVPPNANIVPMYQCVLLYSGQTLLPVLPLFYNPAQQPVLLFEHDILTDVSTQNTTPSTFVPQHFIKGMPFSEQIMCLELSKTGLHLLITTSQNNLFIYSLFTNQWIKYLGETATNSNMSSTTNTSLTPTIFTPSTLILKDALRFVSSDTTLGSEYKIDPAGLYDHIPYILTLLPHGRNDVKEQNEKLFATITAYSNASDPTTKRQIQEYHQQLDVLNNTQIRITAINTNVRFVAVSTDKNKNRSVTLLSFDTHSVIPHSLSQDKNDKDDKLNTDMQHITPSHSKQGLYGGIITFGKHIESHYSLSSLKLPRVELVNSKRNMIAFDSIRKILFIASCAGDKEIFCVEVHKKFFAELNLPQLQTKGHKEAARRASIINPMGIGATNSSQILGEENAHGELSHYLPYVTVYRPYTLSLHFLNKHTLPHPILDMTLRYSKQSHSSWPFLIAIRATIVNTPQSSTGHVGITSSSINSQKDKLLCVDVLELKRRAGVLTSSHRDSIFQFNATKTRSGAGAIESDENMNYSKSGRNKAFEGRKMTRFTTGLNLKQHYAGFIGNFGTNSSSQDKTDKTHPSMSTTIEHMSSINNIFFVSNLQSIQTQLLHCDCGHTDIVYQYQQELSNTKNKLKILPLGQENIQHHLMFQQKEQQQRHRHDSLVFGQPLTSNTVEPGAPKVATISEDQIGSRGQVISQQIEPLNHVIIQPTIIISDNTIQPTKAVLSDVSAKVITPTTRTQPTKQPVERESYGFMDELYDVHNQNDSDDEESEDHTPFSIPYYDDPQFRPPPPAQFNISTDCKDMIQGDKFKYDEQGRALHLSQRDLETSHLNIQADLNIKFGVNTSVGYDQLLSDHQVIETVYREQVMDLQTQLSTCYIELDTMHDANTILKNENIFIRHENRLLQQQRDMLLDILKLRIEDLYTNNIYSNAYQLNQHDAQLNGTAQLANLQWDYNQTYIDFYNHYNIAYMMGKSTQTGNIQAIEKSALTTSLSNTSQYKEDNDDEPSSSPQIKGMKGTLGALLGKIGGKEKDKLDTHDRTSASASHTPQFSPSEPQSSKKSPKGASIPSITTTTTTTTITTTTIPTNTAPNSQDASSSSESLVHTPGHINARQRVQQEQEQTYHEKQRRYESTTLKTSQRAKIVGIAPTLGTLFDDGDEDLDCMLTHNPLQSEDPLAEKAILALSPSNNPATSSKPFFSKPQSDNNDIIVTPQITPASLVPASSTSTTTPMPMPMASTSTISTTTSIVSTQPEVKNEPPIGPSPSTPTSTQNSTQNSIPNSTPDSKTLIIPSSSLTPDANFQLSSTPAVSSTPKPRFIFLKNGKLEKNASDTNNPENPTDDSELPPPPPDDDDEANHDELHDNFTQLPGLGMESNPAALVVSKQPEQTTPKPKVQRPQRQSILDKAKYAKKLDNPTQQELYIPPTSNNKLSVSVLPPVSSLATPIHTNDNDIYVSYSVSKTGYKHPRMRTKEENMNQGTADFIDPLCDPETKEMVFQHIVQHEKQMRQLYQTYRHLQLQHQHKLLTQRPIMLSYKQGCTTDPSQCEEIIEQLKEHDIVEAQGLTLSTSFSNLPNSSSIKKQPASPTHRNPTESKDSIINTTIDAAHIVDDPTFVPEFGNIHTNVLDQHLHDTIHAYNFAEIESLIDIYHKTNEISVEKNKTKNKNKNIIAYTSNPLFQSPTAPTASTASTASTPGGNSSTPSTNSSKKFSLSQHDMKTQTNRSTLSSKSHKYSVFDSYRRFSALPRSQTTGQTAPKGLKMDANALFDTFHRQLASAQEPQNNIQE